MASILHIWHKRRIRGVGRTISRARCACIALEHLESRALLSADLTVSLGMPKPAYLTYVPGDVISVPVVISNAGDAPAPASSAAPLRVDLRGSADNQYGHADVLATQISLTSPLAAGASVTRTVKVTVPAVPMAQLYLVAAVDTAGTVVESNEANNTTASPPATVAWQFGAVPNRSGKVSLMLTDADGTLVTFKLTGPGTGTITSTSDGYSVALANTTTGSTLKITTKAGDGRFTLHDLVVSGPINQISASTTDFTGDISIAQNAADLTLGSLSGSAIRIGAPAVPSSRPPTCKITFGSAQNVAIFSAIGIASLTAVNWLDTDSTADSLAAPYLSSLKITGRGAVGDFAADLTLTGAPSPSANTLGTTTVAGKIGPSSWLITGKTAKITAGSYDAGFAANITGVLEGLIAKSSLSGQISAQSIAAITAPAITNATILAGANLGADLAVGGVSSAADRFSPGYISSVTVSNAITNSTILAGVHPFDNAFNDLNDVAIGGKASYVKSISAGHIDASSRLDAGLLPATAKIAGVAIPTKTDARFGQNKYVYSSAGVTDANGTVAFTIQGEIHFYRFVDKSTQLPIAGASACLAVDAESFSFGLITLVALGKRVPLQLISLTGTKEPASQLLRASTPIAPTFESPSGPAAADPEAISVDLATDISTKAILDLGTPWLTKQVFYSVPESGREIINSKVGCAASAFVSLAGIGLHGLDNVSHGAVSNYLASLPFATSEVMTPDQYKADLLKDLAVDTAGTRIITTMGKKLDPLAPVATAIDLGAAGVNWGTANMAKKLNMGVRVTTIGGFKFSGLAAIAPWDRAASDGTVLARVPEAADAANGFIELISKTNPGEAYVAALDTNGNADVPVPLGDYWAVGHAGGFSATTVPISASAGNNLLNLVLAHAPVPGFTISPGSTLHVSENGATASFTVRLDAAPTANVTLALASTDASEAKISKTSLTFTPADWATPQTVVVTGINDSIVDGTVACMIITRAAVSADANYSGLDPVDINVLNADNEASPTPVITFDSLVISDSESYTDTDPFSGASFRRYKLTGTATANGPVNTYLYTYPGNSGTLIMNGWTGVRSNNHYRAAGDPASTTFTFSIWTGWRGRSSYPYDYTVEVQAAYWDVEPSLITTQSRTITLTY
jgi:hypothetical protein